MATPERMVRASAGSRLDLNFAGDPVVVFIGREARFLSGSKINPGGETDELQLYFTDGIVESSPMSFETDLNTLWDSTTASESLLPDSLQPLLLKWSIPKWSSTTATW
jgi:hypothetical protein